MPVTHPFVSAIGDGGDATLVRPSNWNADHAFPDKNVFLEAPGSVTIATTGRFIQSTRLALATTDRLIAAGTGRLVVDDKPQDPAVLFHRSPGSTTLSPDSYTVDFERLSLYGDSRTTLIANARSVVTDFEPITSRLVLAGRG